MRINCPNCDNPLDLDDQSAGRTVRCDGCGKSFVAPDELAVTGQNHSLHVLPVASVVLLHYVSAGLFTLIYLNLLHERMPRIRRDDPSATVAVGLSFIPMLNLIWLCFSMHRLCVRINEQRRFHGLTPRAPQWLAIPVCGLIGCGALAAFLTQTTGLVVLGAVGLVGAPIFAALVQDAVNELVEQQAEPITVG